MQLSVRDIRIAEVETCDFGLMPSYGTSTVLRAALPDTWEQYLDSDVALRLMRELGVTGRYLTHLPGSEAEAGRLTAFDLARSAVARLRARNPGALERLDALIFVSTSNPHPCNSQAAMLAEEFGLKASCMDLKAGCSGGVLGLMHAALFMQAGCERVLVVMAENLSQLTPPADLRMLLTVGDGAACVLLERSSGPGFLAMIHGTEPAYARTLMVNAAFPPASPETRYAYAIQDANAARRFLQARWRALHHEALAAAGTAPDEIAQWFFHQTHGAQVDALLQDLGVPSSRTVSVVGEHGNMGTPTFAVAMARGFRNLRPGQRYLLQAVGGGVSWCAIVAEHR
jgi:3-oxoacyl-[acyl-carrier-protein] synthase-3